ncbi:ankyrin repeat and MYND domain-containing protein 2-like [Ceratina calcarata]|uniref:Ankyrin repeat and MYND domain-containing protein 2-like n=1 Tax=Ceratina calcarata TaxID=156304 RepID=A0AAJ7IWM0_9HYME|nr:ankyrin repeat and MYND domain-containing protein 2-like [Ceratina calcarata]
MISLSVFAKLFSLAWGDNVHPVHVVICLQRDPEMLESASEIQKALSNECRKTMKEDNAYGQALSFKYHYLSCIVAEVIKYQMQQKAIKAETEKLDSIEGLIRKLMKCNSSGVPEYQEAFLRKTIRTYPNKENIIYLHIVTTLDASNPPSALSVMTHAINSQRHLFPKSKICVTCGEDKAARKCSKCKAVQYCDRECQRLHWFVHKKACTRLDQNIAPSAKISNADKEQISNAGKEQISNAVSSRLRNLSVN